MLGELAMQRPNELVNQHEKGATLIVLVFIMSLLITAYLVKAFNNTNLKLQRDQRVLQELSVAKEALITWTVRNSENLGQLPYPDRAGGGGYDGFSDCPPSRTTFNVPASYQLLIGKLPVYGQTSPCVVPLNGLGLDNNDNQENRLWYAVSRNVVHQYEYLSNEPLSNPIINPSIINNPTYLWLKILDRDGSLISDRVAAVIIAPGNALGNQSRSHTATPNQFLDSFEKNSTIYSNSDYDHDDEDFIVGDTLESVDDGDTTFTQPYLFNDKLAYITIDELMQAITKRVAAEGGWLLNAYQAKKVNFQMQQTLMPLQLIMTCI